MFCNYFDQIVNNNMVHQKKLLKYIFFYPNIIGDLASEKAN